MGRGRLRQVQAPALLVVLAATTVQYASAFCPLDTRWPGGRVTIFFNFAPSGPLSNGTTSWQQNTESAMREWTDVSDAFAFVDGGFADVGQTSGDGVAHGAQARGKHRGEAPRGEEALRPEAVVTGAERSERGTTVPAQVGCRAGRRQPTNVSEFGAAIEGSLRISKEA